MDIIASGLSLLGLIGIGYLGYKMYSKYQYEDFEYQYELLDNGIRFFIEDQIVEGSLNNWFSKGIKIEDRDFNQFMNELSEIAMNIEERK